MLRVLNFMTPARLTPGKLPFLLSFSFLFCLAAPSFGQGKPTPAAVRLKGLEQRQVLEKSSALNHINFRNIGPSVMSGRVDDIEANPNDPTEFYVAYATGGLWHTTNNGQSFTPIFDSADVIGIGDIAINWKTGTIWVGTGEVNSSRSSYAGIGIYKSRDGGKTWQYLGLPESHHIGKILLHPTDDNIAWVAVLGHLYSPNKERGVYKTTDGGATWKQTLAVDENTGAVDLDINPQHPEELFASTWYRIRKPWNFEGSGQTSGIYKSLDGGSTWKLVSGAGSGFPNGKNVGRIGLAVYPKNPQIVYAVVDNQQAKPDTAKKDSLTYALDELKNLSIEEFASLNNQRLDTFLERNRMSPKYSSQQIKELVATGKIKPTSLYDYLYVNTGFEGTPVGAEVYRSNNGGQSWRKTNEKEIPIYSTYGYYFGKIYVSPYNPDKLYALGYSSQVSTDGGKTWKDMDKNNVHADHHALWVDPKRDSHLINGNDGGVNLTYDDGDHWFKANTPPVGQYYSITVDNAKPYNVYGGLQDNGVWYLPSTNGKNSFANSGLGQNDEIVRNIGGGDGMQVQVDQRNNRTTYYGSQFGYYSRTDRLTKEGTRGITPHHELGEKPLRFNWQAPILLSPHNNDILYFGSNKLYRSFNEGDTMIAVTGDITKGGKTGNVPYGTITTISESPLRFGLLYTGTDDGNIEVSKDAGASWTLVSAPRKKGFSLPQDLWVSRLTASRFKEGRVYATLNGYRNDDFAPYLYVSEDYGNAWVPLGRDLPAEPVNVIKEDPKNENILYLGTDGGLYVSLDRGQHFMKWDAGLPKSIPIHDIAIQERENEIVLGTHGRSLYLAKLDEVQKAAR
ncbi:MAG: WD40/YVTN/BNR-like repeat-containing protein [Flavisolibacter sp.]